MLLCLTCFAQYYALVKTHATFYTNMWLHYYIIEDFMKTVYNLAYYASIMLNAFCDLLCSQIYAGMIGLGLCM